MTRSTIISIGEYYHIYNRGIDKSKTFLSKHDYNRFIALLYLANSPTSVRVNMQRKTLNELLEIERGENLVDIGSYCLMPNHFHILIREKIENGISLFMQKLTTGYTMYFNIKNDRSGSLFQGTFKAEHIDNDEYLEYVFTYIHLNPIKLIEPLWKEKGIKNSKEAEKFLESYRYSSYPEYNGTERNEKVILNKEVFPKYFENKKDFIEMIKFWLNYNKNVQG